MVTTIITTLWLYQSVNLTEMHYPMLAINYITVTAITNDYDELTHHLFGSIV